MYDQTQRAYISCDVDEDVLFDKNPRLKFSKAEMIGQVEAFESDFMSM